MLDQVLAAITKLDRQFEALGQKLDGQFEALGKALGGLTVHLSEADKAAIRDLVRPPAPVVDTDFENRFKFIRGPVIPGSQNK